MYQRILNNTLYLIFDEFSGLAYDLFVCSFLGFIVAIIRDNDISQKLNFEPILRKKI